MKVILIFFCALIMVAFLGYGVAGAHSGGLDSKGGHYNRKTGEYHYHRGANIDSKATVAGKTESKSERKTKPAKSADSKKKKR